MPNTVLNASYSLYHLKLKTVAIYFPDKEHLK